MLFRSLKKKYQIADADFFTLVASQRLSDFERTALLLVHRVTEDAADPDSAAPQHSAESESVADIEFVTAQIAAAAGVPMKRPVPVVVERADGIWIAEPFGFPLVYSYADTKEEAKANLLHSLFEYSTIAKQQGSITVGAESTDLVRFGAFLNLLFGDE